MDVARIFAEKRRLILPIAIAGAVNLAVYAVVIYPRTSSASMLEQRAQAARAARANAAADLRDAEAVKTGQDRAAQQLTRFYDAVLPKGREGARRITYRRLATLADESNLDYDRRTISLKRDRESALEQMSMTMVLEGEYRDVRRFIHALEAASEFVVIEDIALAQAEQNAPLTLTVKMATYYKADP